MPRRSLLVFGLIAGCIGFDQGTKRLAVLHLLGARPINLLFGIVRLSYAENTGAWGSLGSHWPPLLKQLAFVIAPGLLLFMMLVFLLTRRGLNLPTILAYSMIVGGGASNLLDRVRAGAVVDFLYVGVGWLGTNIFNVADVAVVAGVLLLLVSGRPDVIVRAES